LLVLRRDGDAHNDIVESIKSDETTNDTAVSHVGHDRRSILLDEEAARCDVAEASMDVVIELVERADKMEVVLASARALSNKLHVDKVPWADGDERCYIDAC
jgi:hypothetical protein